MTTAAKNTRPRSVRIEPDDYDELVRLVSRHTALTEELESLNPFWESDMNEAKPEIETELLSVGDALADLLAEYLDGV